ncbi:MAG TPA: hypothetical protein P5277_02940 [Candidatus Paceibacterota bacterium]|nr:hypothetical protein [Candidatus Paceibacterota bacterium]
MDLDDDKIKATILYHLRRKKVIGGVHTAFDTLRRGFPSHMGKDIDKIAKELIKENLILTKPAPYGLQVSLNKEKIVEIEIFIKNVLGIDFN